MKYKMIEGIRPKSKLIQIKNIFKNIVGFFAMIGILLIVVISIPVYIYRQIVILLAKYFRPDLGDILNGQSSLMTHELFSTRPLRCNIIICMTAKGKLTKEEAEELIMKNWIRGIDSKTGLLKYPNFQQYPVRWLGFTFYKNAFHTFDINNHLFVHPNLGGKDQVTEEDYNEFAEKLLNLSYRPCTSLWEMHLVHNFHNPQICPDSELSLVVLRTHHSLADGFGIFSAVLEGFLEESLSNFKIPAPKPIKQTSVEKLKYIFSAPYYIIKDATWALSAVFRDSPWKVPDSRKKWHQICIKSDLIPRQKITEIKNALGVTFTSVLISAISAGINRHLEKLRQRDYARKTNNYARNYEDESMLCCSTLPLPGHSMRLTNHCTVAGFEVPTVKYSSALERLHHCHESIESVKMSIGPYALKFMLTALGCHLNSVGFALTLNRSIPTGLTSFPLPIFQKPIEKFGKQSLMTDFIVGGMEGCAGVAVMNICFNQHVRIGVSAEQAVMSREDLKYFVKCIIDEINVLHDLVERKTVDTKKEY